MRGKGAETREMEASKESEKAGKSYITINDKV